MIVWMFSRPALMSSFFKAAVICSIIDLIRKNALNDTAPGVPPPVALRLCYGTLYGTPRILRLTTTGK
jgi:hypothetical protein